MVRQLDAATEPRSYAPGARILEYGQEGDGQFFFIESGQVSILVPLQNGGHMRIASLGPGLNFGEMALA
jgi:glutaminase